MRILSTLCLLLISTSCFSQIYDMIRAAEYNPKRGSENKNNIFICGMRGDLSIITNFPSHQPVIMRMDSVSFRYKSPDLNTLPTKKDTSGKPVTIRTRCMKTLTEDDNPLIVIDGVLLEKYNLSSINPNNIESIYILKSSEASAIFGCRAAKGVILITTKSDKIRKFIIKDFLDGNRIPGATVSFISTDKKDTIMMAANDSGVVVIDKLKSSVSYQVYVSATGFKLLIQSFKNGYSKNEQELMLERDIKMCDEVIIGNAGHIIRCSRNYQCINVSKCTMHTVADTAYSFSFLPAKAQLVVGSIYPNPVQKGKTITIETTTQPEGQIQIRLVGLDGKLLLSQPQKAFKGQNRFTINTDSRWAAGIYFVQLYAKGKLLASDKVIIQ